MGNPDNDGETTVVDNAAGVLECANEAFVSIDEDGRIVYWNPYAATLFGWPRDEVLGKPLVDFIIPERYRQAHNDGMARFLKTHEGKVLFKTIEVSALHKSKGEFPIELNIFTATVTGKNVFHAFIRDIRQRKQSEQWAKDVLEAAPDAMIIINQLGDIIFINSQAEKIFGYNKMELQGQKIEVLMPHVYRNQHAEHVRQYFRIPKTRAMGTGLDLYAQRKNHEVFPVEISLSPLMTADGMVALAAVRDITDRKEAEKEIAELNKMLVSTSRQAGMAEIANAILHNLGNILNSVNVSVGILRAKIKDDDYINKTRSVARLLQEHESDMDKFLKDDDRGKLIPTYLLNLAEKENASRLEMMSEVKNLIHQIEVTLDVIAKQQSISGPSLVIEVISAAEAMDTALKLSENTNDTSFEIKRSYDDSLKVHTDKNKLLQILINLIRNAKEALLPAQTHKMIELSIMPASDNTIVFEVKDNGVGLTPEQLDNLFKFGYSTKKDGHGFGLHNCSLLAKELGGILSAASDGIGRGAVFRLKLPHSQAD